MKQMTKPGEFPLKKHSFFCKAVSFLSALFFAFLSLSFFSCKSTSVPLEYVNPLDLIDNKNQFFITIPTSSDPNLVSFLIEQNVEGISSEEAKKISERIEVLYCGMIRGRKSTDFQISGKIDFPQIAQKRVFSKKNGFVERTKTIRHENEAEKNYAIYSKEGLDISFPSDYIALLGRDVEEMLEVYDGKSNDSSYENKNKLDNDVFEFLNVDKDEPDMKFYASRPQSFLTMLTGANLTLKLSYVRGIMRQDPKSEKQYLMDLEFEFRDPRLVPVARGALSLAFGLTDSDVFLENPTHLKISNIKIGKEHLYKILILKK